MENFELGPWKAFAETLPEVRCSPGHLIYLQNTEATCFYYLKKGRVKSFIQSDGGAERVLNVYQAGSLFGEASFFDQLPRVSFDPPKSIIGTNTVECIKSGLMYGSASMIDGLIDRIQAEMGEKCTVIATGGLAGQVVPLCRNPVILDDDLLLKGLMLIYQKNAEK